MQVQYLYSIYIYIYTLHTDRYLIMYIRSMYIVYVYIYIYDIALVCKFKISAMIGQKGV